MSEKWQSGAIGIRTADVVLLERVYVERGGARRIAFYLCLRRQ